MATADLRKPHRRTKVDGSKSGAAVSPKKPKVLNRQEKANPKGRYATHFLALLAERGWTKEQFSEKSGIPDATIRKWLRAESMPLDVQTLEAIAAVLNTPKHPLRDYRLVLPPPK